MPVAESNTNGTVSSDLMKACIDKELFLTGPLKGKCVITKLNVVPTSEIDIYGYEVVTKDYNPFSPYDNPNLGSVMYVDFLDCDT